jgi:hypothetical protein
MHAILRPELPLYRLYLLRAMYAVLAFVQGDRTWSAIVRHTGPWELWNGVGHSFFGALTVLSLIGLRYPVRMLPLLVYARHCRQLPLHRPRRRDRAAASSVELSLEELRDRAGRPVALTGCVSQVTSWMVTGSVLPRILATSVSAFGFSRRR